jgi:hypothetical protein
VSFNLHALELLARIGPPVMELMMCYNGTFLTPLGILVNSICVSLLFLYIMLKFSVTWIRIGYSLPFPSLTIRYLTAIIYLVGFLFSIFDFVRQTLSVNGFSYLNVTDVVRKS